MDEAARASGAAINPIAAACDGGAVYDDKTIAIENGETIVIEDDERAVGTKEKPIIIQDNE